MKEKDTKFSVELGLFDFINPIFYTITSFTIIKHMNGMMDRWMFSNYILGVAISLLFGFSIPTVKFLVGIGKMDFKMPVNLVCFTNSGIFVSGLMFSSFILELSTVRFIELSVSMAVILTVIYLRSRKFNTLAVFIGGIGYILFYISLISLSVVNHFFLPVVFYAVAICFFIFLILIGCKSDLMNPKVHWTIEISNVICQGSVAIGTVILFSHI